MTAISFTDAEIERIVNQAIDKTNKEFKGKLSDGAISILGLGMATSIFFKYRDILDVDTLCKLADKYVERVNAIYAEKKKKSRE